MTDPNPAPSTVHAPASAADVKQHADEHWARFEHADQQQAGMGRIRMWTIAGVIALGTGAWLLFMR